MKRALFIVAVLAALSSHGVAAEKPDAVYDAAMRYRMTAYRAALDTAIKAADKAVLSPNPSARTIYGLCELSRMVPVDLAAKYRAYVDGVLSKASKVAKKDLFLRQSLEAVSEVECKRRQWCDLADKFPAQCGLPDGEHKARFRIFDGRLKDPCSKSAADKVAKEPIPDWPDELYLEFKKNGNRSRYERRWLQRLENFEILVSAEIAEGKGCYISRIEDYLRAYCDAKSWIWPAHDGRIKGRNGTLRGILQIVDLVSSELAAAFACCVDRLGEKINPSLLQRLKTEVERRTFTPIRRELRFMKSQGGDPKDMGNRVLNWWIDSVNNWNSVCWDNVVCAAFVFLDDPVDRAMFIDGAIKSIDMYMTGFAADGYCSEGMGYWNYGFGHHMLMGVLLRRLSDGNVDIFTRPLQRKIAEYARNYELKPGISPAFADGVGHPTSDNLRMVDTIWPGNSRERKAISVFPDGQVWLFRAENGLSVAFKGGHNGERHNHNDVGSYYIVKDGRFVSGDAGREEYTARTFSSRRYESPILNSYGHPVPMIDGELQKTGESYGAKVVSQSFGDRVCSVSLEIKGAYGMKKLKSAVRTFIWERSGASFTVKDVLEFSEPAKVEVPYLVYEGVECEPEIVVRPSAYTVKKERIPNPNAPYSPDRIAVIPSGENLKVEVSITFR